MASTRKPAQPITTGRHAGLYAVRWRKTAGGKQFTGYLPSLSLLAAYSEHERQCWADGVIPEPPEVHFAEQIERILTDRSARVAKAQEVTPARSSPTLLEWVGSRTYLGSNRHEYTFGPFFAHADKRHSEASKRGHVALVSSPEMAEAAKKPMDELEYRDYETAFNRLMACATCIQRCIAAGVTPGTDKAPWEQLVPKVEAPTWDGQRCDTHHTRLKRKSYEGKLMLLVAHHSATRTAKAKRAGVAPLQRDAVPTAAELFDEVVFCSSIEVGGDEQEELRYGLNSQQVKDLQDASPPHLRALPIVAAFTLSRGGQELTGPRIKDVQPYDPRFILDPAAPPVGGTVNLHNFRHRRVNGTCENRPRGKTKGSRRECPLGELAMSQIRDHIRSFRSTPHPRCPGCRAGHSHWPTNDHSNNPHVYDEHGEVKCPMAGDAPLWVDESGRWLDAQDYTRRTWPAICERAGLTDATLGWQPLPRHFRSTGTTMHMESPNPDIALVVRLGGWTSEDMIRDHYYRRSPQALLAAIQRVEDAHFREEPRDGASDLERLQHQLRWTAMKLEQAQRRLIQAGLDMTVTPVTVAAKVDRPTAFTREAVLDAVRCAILDRRSGAGGVLEYLGVAPAKGNYTRLRQEMTNLGLPLPPGHFGSMSPRRQQPYLDELRRALEAVRPPESALRAV